MQQTQEIDENEQTRAFLAFLLDHEDGCLTEDCPLCLTAQKIYALINSRSLGPSWPLVCRWNETARIQ